MKKLYTLLSATVLCLTATAQVPADGTVPMDTVITPSGDTLFVPKDNDIVYDTAAYTGGGTTDRGYCNNSVSGLSPTKIISIGYDYVGPFSYNSTQNFSGVENTIDRKAVFNGGLRIGGNIPLVSRTKMLINFGFNYWRSGYKFKDTPQPNDYFGQRLQKRGLNNIGLALTFFKPLNDRHFIIVMVQGEVSGDYSLKELPGTVKHTKGSYTALFGWKKQENKLLAVGASRTWRGGESLPIPVLLWNQTFNDKWGMELLLPARGAVRYNFSPRSLLLLGYELEGTSYNMAFDYNANGQTANNDRFEYRRSEIRARLTWEKQLLSFIWLSAQAGVRLNYRNAVAFDNQQDRGAFVIDNKVGAAPYGIISINLVSP